MSSVPYAVLGEKSSLCAVGRVSGLRYRSLKHEREWHTGSPLQKRLNITASLKLLRVGKGNIMFTEVFGSEVPSDCRSIGWRLRCLCLLTLMLAVRHPSSVFGH